MASLGSLALPKKVTASRGARVLTRERFASILMPMITVVLLGILHQAQGPEMLGLQGVDQLVGQGYLPRGIQGERFR